MEEIIDNSTQVSLLEKCTSNIPTWKNNTTIDKYTISQLTGGQVNKMYKITSKEPKISPESVLVRIFKQNTENFNRENENNIFQQLSNFQCGPHCYFANQEYRIEEYIENMKMPDLPHIMLADEKYCITFAESLARFHTCKIDQKQEKVPILNDLLFNNQKLQEFQEKINNIFDYPSMDQQIINQIKHIYDQGNLDFLRNLQQKEIDQSQLVFCQNDLYEQNILYSKEQKKLMIIDLDFAGYNYQNCEFGQYLTENSGMGQPDLYKQLPEESLLIRFFKIYLLFFQIFENILKFDNKILLSTHNIEEKIKYLVQIVEQSGIKEEELNQKTDKLLQSTYRACIVNNFAAVYFSVMFSGADMTKEDPYLPWGRSRYLQYLKMKEYYELNQTLKDFQM